MNGLLMLFQKPSWWIVYKEDGEKMFIVSCSLLNCVLLFLVLVLSDVKTVSVLIKCRENRKQLTLSTLINC